MTTDEDEPRYPEHIAEQSPAERARYMTMLGRWARGEVTANDLSEIPTSVAPPAGK